MSDNEKLPMAAELLDVGQVGVMLGCSTRHVWRMVDRGEMPEPLRLGNLRRWRKNDLEAWISAGCKPVRAASRR